MGVVVVVVLEVLLIVIAVVVAVVVLGMPGLFEQVTIKSDQPEKVMQWLV